MKRKKREGEEEEEVRKRRGKEKRGVGKRKGKKITNHSLKKNNPLGNTKGNKGKKEQRRGWSCQKIEILE